MRPPGVRGVLDEHARNGRGEGGGCDHAENHGQGRHSSREREHKKFRYIRTGPDHLSLAFTYALIAATDLSGHRGLIEYCRQLAKKAQGES